MSSCCASIGSVALAGACVGAGVLGCVLSARCCSSGCGGCGCGDKHCCYTDKKNKDSNPLVVQCLKLFEKSFGCGGGGCKLLGASAPGRVNLIGEHTDYCDGFVFPMAIDRMCVIIGRKNGTDKYRLASVGIKEVAEFTFEELMAIPAGRPPWHAYMRGVVAQYVKKGLSIPPFDAAICGNVPLGGGLSSSAALEVSTATFLDQLIGQKTDAKEKALMCQKAEHEYAKMPCGVMDQFISSCGKQGHALFIDCRSLDTQLVSMNDPNVVVLITNSHVKHELNTGEYAVRRKQCEAAVAVLKKRNPAVKALRDATLRDLQAVKKQLDAVVFKRARHVIGENDRCVQAVKALSSGDFAGMGVLMNASHNSLRDDFEVSCSEIDVLVDIARAQPGVYGSRITGGGFGGCTVTLVQKQHVAAVQKAIETEYLAKVGKKCTCMVSSPSDGAKAIKVPSLCRAKL